MYVLRIKDFRPPGWGLWLVGLLAKKFPGDQKPPDPEVSLREQTLPPPLSLLHPPREAQHL